MRYERQVVLEMQKGSAVPVAEGEVPSTTPVETKPAAKPSAPTARPSASAPRPAPKAAVTKKAPAKTARPKPAVKKSTPVKPVALTQQRPASKDGESFWIHSKKGSTSVEQGSGTEPKVHPPQVVH
jgi:cell division protein FtsQ